MKLGWGRAMTNVLFAHRTSSQTLIALCHLSSVVIIVIVVLHCYHQPVSNVRNMVTVGIMRMLCMNTGHTVRMKMQITVGWMSCPAYMLFVPSHFSVGFNFKFKSHLLMFIWLV